MYNIRKSGRFSFKSKKRDNYSRTSNSYSNNKPRSKGNAVQLYDKYVKLAKESSLVGDRIQAEYYHQFADHYSRIMTENGMKTLNDENINENPPKKSLESSSTGNDQETEKTSTNNNIQSSEKLKIEEEDDEIDKTLETVSFISQPAKKTAKLKK